MTTELTKRQRSNLRLQRMEELMYAVHADPSRRAHFHLDNWVEKCATGTPVGEQLVEPTCGTTACAVGTACFDPWFNEQGLHHKQYVNTPVYVTDTVEYRGWNAVAEFFGITVYAAYTLFSSEYYNERHSGPADVARRIRLFLLHRP